jgi:hypothetical protein
MSEVSVVDVADEREVVVNYVDLTFVIRVMNSN